MNRSRARIVALAVGPRRDRGRLRLSQHPHPREPGAHHDEPPGAPAHRTAQPLRGVAAPGAGAEAARAAARAGGLGQRVSVDAERRAGSRRLPPPPTRRRDPQAPRRRRRQRVGELRPMTDTSHRMYAVAIAVVVFCVSWASVAAKPWATTKQDPRLAALAQREQRLRADATLVQQAVDQRMAAYRVALRSAAAADRDGHTPSRRRRARRRRPSASSTCRRSRSRGRRDAAAIVQGDGNRRGAAPRRGARRACRTGARPGGSGVRAPRAGDVALPRRLGALPPQPRRRLAAASPDLARVVELALAARERTDGRFDPTVHDAVVAAGYDRTFDDVTA